MNLKAGFLQFAPEFGEPAANLEIMLQLMDKSPRLDLLVLPELCLTGYVIKDRREEDMLFERQEECRWREKLLECSGPRNTAIVLGFIEKASTGYFNSSIFLAPDNRSVIYRKSHLFMREPEWFQPGDSGPVLAEWRGVKLGLGICLDHFYPEYWRCLALAGADIFCLPANLVTDNGQPGMNVRSRENRVFSIIANRTGEERGISFCGRSQIISPRGGILAELREATGIMSAEIEIEQARDKYLLEADGVRYNHLLQGRRPEIYAMKPRIERLDP